MRPWSLVASNTPCVAACGAAAAHGSTRIPRRSLHPPLPTHAQARYWLLRYLCAFLGAFPGLEHLASWLLIALFSVIPTMPVAQLGCPYKRVGTAPRGGLGKDATSTSDAEPPVASVRSIQLRVALMIFVLTSYVCAVVVASGTVVCLVAYFALAPLLCHCMGVGVGVGATAGTNSTASTAAASFCSCVHHYY